MKTEVVNAIWNSVNESFYETETHTSVLQHSLQMDILQILKFVVVKTISSATPYFLTNMDTRYVYLIVQIHLMESMTLRIMETNMLSLLRRNKK